MRRLLLVLTLVAGPVVAVLLDRVPFAAAALPVHGAISLFLPCLVILLDRDRRPRAIAVLAVGAGTTGDGACVLASGSWDTRVALGGLAAQGLTAVAGLACGRCIRRPSWACLAVTVVPIGVWALLGAIGATGLQAWLTPYGVITGLLAGATDAWLRVVPLAAVLGLVVAIRRRDERVRSAVGAGPAQR